MRSPSPTPNDLNVHYLSHLWSLGVEEQFYIVWPLVFSLLASKRMRLVWLCVAVVGLCVTRMQLGYGGADLTHAPKRWTIPAIHPIALGAILAILMQDERYGALVRQRVSSWATILFAVLLLGLPLAGIESVSVEVLGAIGIALMVGWIITNKEAS